MSDNIKLNLTLSNEKCMYVAAKTCFNTLKDRTKVLF